MSAGVYCRSISTRVDATLIKDLYSPIFNEAKSERQLAQNTATAIKEKHMCHSRQQSELSPRHRPSAQGFYFHGVPTAAKTNQE